MHIYGLTGGIASGKTTVSKHLEQLGCPIIDADIISRQVVSPHQPAWKAIIGAFGVDVLNNDGTLNRSKLGDLIFHDENQRKLLNIITHPYIQRAMIWQILKHFLKGEQFVVVVSPLLYESNRFLRYMKKIIVVSCSKEQQLMRLMNRDNLTESDALTRIQSQMPLEEKCKRSDYVIDNTDEMEFTRQQTFNLYFNMKRISRLCGLHRWLMVVTIVIGFIALKFIVL